MGIGKTVLKEIEPTTVPWLTFNHHSKRIIRKRTVYITELFVYYKTLYKIAWCKIRKGEVTAEISLAGPLSVYNSIPCMYLDDS